MRRTTISLPDDLHARAVAEAARQGLSLAEFVRGALALALVRAGGESDPFFDDDAVFEGEAPSDLAAGHDRYLYARSDGPADTDGAGEEHLW